MTKQELREIERVVNDEIRRNFALAELMAIDDAKAKGAMALFGEKYDDEVRVVTGDYSIDFVVVRT